MCMPFFYGPTASRACNLCLIPPVESRSPPKGWHFWMVKKNTSFFKYNKFSAFCKGQAQPSPMGIFAETPILLIYPHLLLMISSPDGSRPDKTLPPFFTILQSPGWGRRRLGIDPRGQQTTGGKGVGGSPDNLQAQRRTSIKKESILSICLIIAGS